LIISSTVFSGVARGQQYDAGYSGGNYDGNYGLRATYAGGSAGGLAIPGMEGLQGFEPGENIMNLAIIPVSQQGNQLFFEVIGFAITNPASGQSVVYSMGTPLAGVIDPTQNTMQVDISNIATAIEQAGYISGAQVYNTMRTDSRVVIIDIRMTYQGFEGSQTLGLLGLGGSQKDGFGGFGGLHTDGLGGFGGSQNEGLGGFGGSHTGFGSVGGSQKDGFGGSHTGLHGFFTSHGSGLQGLGSHGRGSQGLGSQGFLIGLLPKFKFGVFEPGVTSTV
jgi:hypothetical protein